MKNFYQFFLAAVIALLFSSCVTRYYGPALYQNDVQYMAKPFSKDSLKNRFYVTSILLSQTGAVGQGTSNSGLLNIYRSSTIPHFNFSYGALLFAGNYAGGSADTLLGYKHKSFMGYGFNGSTSFYLSTRTVDFRIIGLDLVYTHESGDYLKFRRAVAGQQNIYSATDAGMFSYGIFTEIIFMPNNNLNLGLKFAVTHVTGPVNRELNNVDGSFTIGNTVFIGYKHVILHVTGAVGSTPFNLNGAIQLGLGYRF